MIVYKGIGKEGKRGKELVESYLLRMRICVSMGGRGIVGRWGGGSRVHKLQGRVVLIEEGCRMLSL